MAYERTWALIFQYLQMNRIVLHNVVVSYFHDVDRHKAFHGTKLIDEVKQGAYTMKWVTMLRPIQFDCEDQEASQDVLYINEIYAIRCGLSFMKISPDELPEPIYFELLYTLRNRAIDERMLFVWLTTLQCLVDCQRR